MCYDIFIKLNLSRRRYSLLPLTSLSVRGYSKCFDFIWLKACYKLTVFNNSITLEFFTCKYFSGRANTCSKLNQYIFSAFVSTLIKSDNNFITILCLLYCTNNNIIGRKSAKAIIEPSLPLCFSAKTANIG